METYDHSNNDSGWIDYDYAIVRVVPRVHLGTFINVGVVLHSRTTGFIDARIIAEPERMGSLRALLNVELLCRFLSAYQSVCRGGEKAAPIGMMPPSERFHWLTAPRSAVIQTSAVHPGRCHDLSGVLDSLFARHCQAIGM